MRLRVKVVPGASREGIAGWLGEELKVRVRAPAERGKANAAVEKLVARTLGLPEGSARVVAGHTSPRKSIDVPGLSDAEVHERLASALGDPSPGRPDR
jgi:uncharacterized protein (TIGR00251 family)